MKADPRAIYEFILDSGWSHDAVCGMLGNMQQESDFETGALGFDESGSYGLCQWLGARKRRLFEFAERHGLPPGHWEIQVRFMLRELEHTEARASRAIRDAPSPAAAARIFCQLYERPAKQYAHIEKRIAYANRFDVLFSEQSS